MRSVSVQSHRALLFVPALRHEYFAKAAGSGADAVILDLEDGVSDSNKELARQTLSGAANRLRDYGVSVMVRVNRNCREDLLACEEANPDAILLPKVETPQEVVEAKEVLLKRRLRAGPGPHIYVCIESAGGVLRADAIAGATPIAGLMFGAGDFVVSTGMDADPSVLRFPAQQVVLAAAAHGIPALGLAGLVSGHRDLATFERLSRDARALGFTGSPAIHPAQIPVLQRVFGACDAERARTSEIVAAVHAPRDDR